MSASVFLVGTVVAILVSGRCFGAEGTIGAVQGSEWETREFPKIGLIVQVPKWPANIKDQPQSWSLTAYPVQGATPPRTNVFDRVVISVRKLPRTNAPASAGVALALITQQTNQFWIAIRRDMFATNAFYECEGFILRMPRRRSQQTKTPEGATNEELVADVRRILKSIEVLHETAKQ